MRADTKVMEDGSEGMSVKAGAACLNQRLSFHFDIPMPDVKLMEVIFQDISPTILDDTRY